VKPRWNYPEEAPVVRKEKLTLCGMTKKHDDTPRKGDTENSGNNSYPNDGESTYLKSTRPSSARIAPVISESPKVSARPFSARPARGVTGNGESFQAPGAWTSDTFLQPDKETQVRPDSSRKKLPPRPKSHSASVPSLHIAQTTRDRPDTAFSSCPSTGSMFSNYSSSAPSSSSSRRHQEHIRKSKFVSIKRVADRTEPFRPSGIAGKDSMIVPATKNKPLARVGGGFIDTRTGIAAGGNKISDMKKMPGRTRNTARMHSSIDQLIDDIMACQNNLERQAIKMEFTKTIRRFAKTKSGGGGKY
jgi:hypothetical protein